VLIYGIWKESRKGNKGVCTKTPESNMRVRAGRARTNQTEATKATGMLEEGSKGNLSCKGIGVYKGAPL